MVVLWTTSEPAMGLIICDERGGFELVGGFGLYLLREVASVLSVGLMDRL